jgi:hypothetical protein
MAQQIFVISDLHLGGEPGFEMCSRVIAPEGLTTRAGTSAE